ncbi:uncharacterized protein [Panulirus ornatus]|uniref:uncharacterized protein n=1 Tax=Panulirus ornatus TaxID=150431 RepID=UPI003A8737EC
MNNNPWVAATPADEVHLQPSHVAAFLSRQLLKKKEEEADKAAERSKKREYVVKERNYVTYNYVEAEESDAGEIGDNPLSSILVRAMQRKVRRQEIEEAMKIKRLEESKRKVEEEKRQCEEARRRQRDKLREMRENHRLRLVKEEQWRAREARRARHNKLADDFRKQKLLRHYFGAFKRLVKISRENKIRARKHYRQKILQRAFLNLRIHRDNRQRWRDQVAIRFHNECLLRKAFTHLKKAVAAREEQVARAVEHHRQLLLHRHVWLWRWAALDLLLERRAGIQRAKEHYHRKVLRHALSRWRKYLEGKRTRRQREIVGTRLRFLVKDIIPDFSPASSEDDEDEDALRKDSRWEDMLSVLTV